MPASSLAHTARVVVNRRQRCTRENSRRHQQQKSARVIRASATESADASSTKKNVVVLGGSGFVGSRVVKRFADAGAVVTSVSKSGKSIDGAARALSVNLADQAEEAKLVDALRGADVAVSCVGVIGTDDAKMREGNGDFNVRAIEAAKKAGVGRFVYVSVASVVPNVVGKTPLMKGYFEGKTMAEECLAKNYEEEDYFIVKPSFIYGGEEFSLTPPRVTKTYGDLLSKVLGSGPVKAIAAKAPGPIALTLAEPVSVDDVAGACVAGAMGAVAGSVVDGTDEIKEAASKA